MRVSLKTAVFALFVVGFSSVSYATEYVEPGRIGVEALVTTGTFQGGLNYVNDFLDVGLDVQAVHITATDTVLNVNTQTNSIGTQLRAGKRFNIHDYNYLVLGGIVNNTFGTQGPVSESGTFSVGPYVGLQRHFPNSPLMLTIYIRPYTYSVANANDGLGFQNQTKTSSFLSNGAFGISYLF